MNVTNHTRYTVTIWGTYGNAIRYGRAETYLKAMDMFKRFCIYARSCDTKASSVVMNDLDYFDNETTYICAYYDVDHN